MYHVSIMLRQPEFEIYRRMTPREKIREMQELIRIAERALRAHPAHEIRRRLDAYDRIRRKSVDALLEKLSELDDVGDR